MAEGSAQSYAAMFERLTGRTTITKSQTVDVRQRLDEAPDEHVVPAALDGTDRAFEDVIDDPEQF